MEEALPDIAKPWSPDKLNRRASLWMLENAKLTPQKIVEMADQDLGDLVKINQKPDCILQQGYDSFSAIKHTYAICTNNAQFTKQSVKLKIRLIQENNSWKINDFISVD